MKTSVKFGIGAMLAAILLLNLVFVPAVCAGSSTSDKVQMPKELKQWIMETQKDEETKLWMKEQTEQWMQNHTLNVTSTKTYTYKDGLIEIKETYTGRELKKNLGINKFEKMEKLKVPENAEKALSLNGETFALTEGNQRITITEKTVVITTETDPFEWWDIGYEYPQYTWSEYYGVYTRADPINLAWEGTNMNTIKGKILDEGWVSVAYPYEHNQYVSDPQYDWVLDEGVADDKTGLLTERYHVRLFDLSTQDIVGNAHRDSLPLHEVIELETAEDLVAGFFDNDVSNWWVLYDYEELDNEEGTPNQEPFCDGEATCIFKVGS
jgi:hypothetical protein